MTAYYNELDRHAAAWLRALIDEGHIAYGHVDERDICDVTEDDIKGYTQCHFFAGIGGWSYALRLAEWPDDRPAWTGSCPCQPFSQAGKQQATNDKRHLWPEFYRLIECIKPSTIFGEQVASQLGLAWLDGVFVDLERSGYATAAADLCAAGFGAPHIRQRLFWVGHADSGGLSPWNQSRTPTRHGQATDAAGRGSERLGDTNRVEHTKSQVKRLPQQQTAARASGEGHWADYEIVQCLEPTKDGGQLEKRRRTESGVLPLAHGVPNRVGSLRGYGNAIVPQVAEAFIRCFCDVILEAST